MARLNVSTADLAADLAGLSPYLVGVHIQAVLQFATGGAIRIPLQHFGESWAGIAHLWKEGPDGWEPKRGLVKTLSAAQLARNAKAAGSRWAADAYRDRDKPPHLDAYRDKTPTPEPDGQAPVVNPYRDATVMPIGTKQGGQIAEQTTGEAMPIGIATKGGDYIGGESAGPATEETATSSSAAQPHAHDAEVWPTFADFWEAFGYKVDKAKAMRSWRRLKQADREAVMAHLEPYTRSTHTDGRFPSRRYPATYLNNRTWENEQPTAPPSGGADLLAQALRHRHEARTH